MTKITKITNTELVVYLLYDSKVPLSPNEIYNDGKKTKKDISRSVIGSFLSRSSNNKKIDDRYRSNEIIFRKINDKYELIDKNNKKVLQYIESYNNKIKDKIENKVKTIIDLGFDLKPSNDEIDLISKLFVAMKK